MYEKCPIFRQLRSHNSGMTNKKRLKIGRERGHYKNSVNSKIV